MMELTPFTIWLISICPALCVVCGLVGALCAAIGAIASANVDEPPVRGLGVLMLFFGALLILAAVLIPGRAEICAMYTVPRLAVRDQQPGGTNAVTALDVLYLKETRRWYRMLKPVSAEAE